MLKILFFFTLLVIDQLTKQLALSGKIPFLHTYLEITTCNPYISWGIPLHGILLWLFLAIATLFLLYTLFKDNFSYPLILITIGALGNIIDRIRFNCVLDFISLGNFPLFNLADTFITIGAILFLWHELKKSKN